MFDQIRDFFARLFGENSQEAPVTVSERGIAAPEEGPEDAADLGEYTIISEEKAPPKARTVRARGIGTPEGLVGDTIELDDFVAPPPVQITTPRFHWLLDNGHGSLQKGKRSPLFADGTQLEEWEFNRDVVKRMAKKLDEIGVQYHIVVPEDEVGSFLKERVARANNFVSPLDLKTIFVSVHANALGNGVWQNGAKGLEVWHFPGSNSGKRLASAFQRALMETFPDRKDRGIKSHQSGSSKIFSVLRNTNMPAVLTENGFYTDEEEAAWLMTPEARQQIADAHVAAIVKIEQEGWEEIEIYRPNMVIG
ncbi:MAG: N-acetylmuramoyl-L-alanine amidase [Bacteroidota bacterium]